MIAFTFLPKKYKNLILVKNTPKAGFCFCWWKINGWEIFSIGTRKIQEDFYNTFNEITFNKL